LDFVKFLCENWLNPPNIRVADSNIIIEKKRKFYLTWKLILIYECNATIYVISFNDNRGFVNLTKRGVL
jgi:hypothetical protein